MTLQTALVVAVLVAFGALQTAAMSSDTWDRAESKFLSWAAERPAIGYPVLAALLAIVITGVVICAGVVFETGRNVAIIVGFH